MASAAYATAPVNGATTPLPAEDEELCDQLLRLRDVVIAGRHASFKLPSSVIAQLKSTLNAPDAQGAAFASQQLNTIADASASSTNQPQLQQSSSFPTFTGLPGLQASSAPFSINAAHSYGATHVSARGLDPIFLEKSDSLVRAEGQLKRQRLERDLQSQVDSHKHASRDKDPGVDAPSPIDIDITLLSALERVKPISGLKVPERSGSAASSFDENDYYSSQVQSDWSSETSSNKASDRAAGAFTADFEPLDGARPTSNLHAKHPAHAKQQTFGRPAVATSPKVRPLSRKSQPQVVHNVEDEDDEYAPPDATAIDSFREHGVATKNQQVAPPDDDDSDYEPGEITEESNIPTPSYQVQQPVQRSPHVPVIRNHLTHIAAPQPNRVSPLATAKGPSIELELVNGRPEVVQKPQQRSNHVPSRLSSASPSANGVSGAGKKRRNKKRKREQEPNGRAKRRRERQNVVESPASPLNQEPYIKDEPMSPPPFANLPEVPHYAHAQYRPAQIDLVSPRQAPPMHYAPEPPRSGLRYEYFQPNSPTVVRVASPGGFQPVQRDNQDLRRVASLHYAQRPPPARVYSPFAPYKAAMTYGEPRPTQAGPPAGDADVVQYQESSVLDGAHSTSANRSRSPPRRPEYRDSYVERAASPAPMPPLASAPGRQIITDQYGNRYVAVGPAPAPAPAPAPTRAPVYNQRASVAPIERHSQPQMAYEQAQTRSSPVYSQQPPPTAHARYEPVDSRMMPPPQTSRQQVVPERQVEYVDANNYRVQDYDPQPIKQTHFTEAPTSPVYQKVPRYEQMPPPPQPAQQLTSPIYVPRSYSVHPETSQQPPTHYIRQASIAPVQYVRQDVPPPQTRAFSVVLGTDYSAPTQPQREYSQAYVQQPPPQQNVRYVDANGNEVFPQGVRQFSEFRYQ